MKTLISSILSGAIAGGIIGWVSGGTLIMIVPISGAIGAVVAGLTELATKISVSVSIKK